MVSISSLLSSVPVNKLEDLYRVVVSFDSCPSESGSVPVNELEYMDR